MKVQVSCFKNACRRCKGPCISSPQNQESNSEPLIGGRAKGEAIQSYMGHKWQIQRCTMRLAPFAVRLESAGKVANFFYCGAMFQ